MLRSHGAHALVVHAVLEVDDDAVRLSQVAGGELRGPLRVVALHRQEDRVEGLRDGLQLVEVERLTREEAERRLVSAGKERI